MHSVMIRLEQPPSEMGREVEIDEELHAGRVRGSSRSRSVSAAKRSASAMSSVSR